MRGRKLGQASTECTHTHSHKHTHKPMSLMPWHCWISHTTTGRHILKSLQARILGCTDGTDSTDTHTHTHDLPLLCKQKPKIILKTCWHAQPTHTLRGQSSALINIVLTTTGSLATSLPSLIQQHPLPVSMHVGVHRDLTWAELGEGNEGC